MTVPLSALVATITCALATLVLVGAEWRGWALARVLAKFVASGSFIVVGAHTFSSGIAGAAHAGFGTWIVIGLVFGAIGDILLLGHSTKAFLAGLVAFLLGHLAYVVAITYLVPPGDWLAGAGPLAALPAIAGVTTVALLWRRLGSLKIPVVFYLLAIVTMTVAAIAAWRLHALGRPQHELLGLGAVLFFASDVSVARNRFIGDSITNKAWGLPAYFAGQLLIAWSAL